MYLLIKGGSFSIEMLDFGDVVSPPRLETMSLSDLPWGRKSRESPGGILRASAHQQSGKSVIREVLLWDILRCLVAFIVNT